MTSNKPPEIPIWIWIALLILNTAALVVNVIIAVPIIGIVFPCIGIVISVIFIRLAQKEKKGK